MGLNGTIPEEIFGICIREDCELVKMLRHRALRGVLRRGSGAPSELLVVTERAIRRVGYVKDMRNAVIKEYAKVLSMDIPLNEFAATLLGGRPGQTLEELVYSSDDPVVDALHTAMMAFLMEYVEGSDLRRLEVLEFAAYAVLMMLHRGRMDRGRAAELLKWIADRALESA
jgi:hypothetical protein